MWHELDRGPAILRGVSLSVGAGERVALMGRNGAGKSTLLRHAAGLMRPTRGKVERSGRVALLLQNPNDYLVHDRVEQEASAGALATVGLGDPALRRRHPRDLSGGEKQRLALAIVLDGEGGSRPRGGGRVPGRADPRDGPPPQGRAGRAAVRTRRRGDRGDPRPRVRGGVRRAGDPARRRRADRRRIAERGAGGRDLLRHRDGADPRRRRRRAAPRGRRRPAQAAAAEVGA